MQVPFKTRLYTGFVLAVVFSAVSGIISSVIFQKQAAQRLWVKRARYVLDSSKNIQTMVIDMETGRRGFRSTNQTRFLEPYLAAKQHIDPTIAGLKDLLSDDPKQESKAQLLEKDIDHIMLFWRNNGDDASKYSRDDVTRITDSEKKQMDDIRSIISDLQKEENKLLIKRRDEYDGLIHDATLSASIDSILCELIIIILIFLIVKEFQKRRKAQQLLKGTVAQLEDQAIVLKNSEDELKKALIEVAEINKQLEKFVYTVAHDIKSPLSGIIGTLSVLEADDTIASNPELAEFVNLSSEQVFHMSEMVNSILEYSRVSLKQQQEEVVNTKELVEKITSMMYPPKNIRIEVKDPMPVLETKKIKIMEVFQNLISNAIKYNDKKQGLIEIGCSEKGDRYEFYVRDNGAGISEKNIEKIFTLFRTTHSQSARESSTGFGLNIVKLIVEQEGGKIWVESVPRQGSTFYFDWLK